MEKTYPSVELVYPIAVASYDAALRRLDTIDGRLQTVLAFIVTTFAALASIANAHGVSFHSRWFYVAAFLLAGSVAFGTHSRLAGKVKLLDPNLLYDHWLRQETWDFQKNFIAYAGDAFEANLSLVDRKWRSTVTLILIFCAQTVALLVWVAARRF